MPNIPPARPLQIAIDGYVAAGKSTVGAALARQLGLLYLDSGVMYRAVALLALERGVDPDDAAACGALAAALDLRLLPPTVDDGRQLTVLVGDRDVTWAIRSDGVNRVVSRVAAHPGVRAALIARQQAIAGAQGVVMVGRDITSVVLPAAQVKIWLDAPFADRVRRRAAELLARDPAHPPDLAWLAADIRRRDAADSAQMSLTPDTVIIQNDGPTAQTAIDRIIEVIHARKV